MLRNKLQTVIKAIILSGWLVMLVLLVQRTYLQPTTVIALDIITEEGVRAGDEWFGIYQQSRKIGYAHMRIEPKGNAYHLYEEAELDLLVLGSVQRVRTVINSYTTKNFLLTYFDFAMRSESASMCSVQRRDHSWRFRSSAVQPHRYLIGSRDRRIKTFPR